MTKALRRKLSYKYERELAALPGELAALEAEQRELIERMSAPNYHRVEPQDMRADSERAAALEALLQEKFDRWELLERQAAGSAEA